MLLYSHKETRKK